MIRRKADLSTNNFKRALSVGRQQIGRLILGQCQVSDKSNEITAIPKLPDVLDIKGAIVTFDAMGGSSGRFHWQSQWNAAGGYQRAIATKILEKGADYLVTLKANQGKKFMAVQELCAATCFSRSAIHRPVHDEFDDDHSRLSGGACSSAQTPQNWNRSATG